mmetsp:Transcript_48959/g.113472  ORF Transcript_48959/g.113472 Transcript_48959/m.113472 type:complete len:282 (+) Transcript_48959:555-1400(+)
MAALPASYWKTVSGSSGVQVMKNSSWLCLGRKNRPVGLAPNLLVVLPLLAAAYALGLLTSGSCTMRCFAQANLYENSSPVARRHSSNRRCPKALQAVPAARIWTPPVSRARGKPAANLRSCSSPAELNVTMQKQRRSERCLAAGRVRRKRRPEGPASSAPRMRKRRARGSAPSIQRLSRCQAVEVAAANLTMAVNLHLLPEPQRVAAPMIAECWILASVPKKSAKQAAKQGGTGWPAPRCACSGNQRPAAPVGKTAAARMAAMTNCAQTLIPPLLQETESW